MKSRGQLEGRRHHFGDKYFFGQGISGGGVNNGVAACERVNVLVGASMLPRAEQQALDRYHSRRCS